MQLINHCGYFFTRLSFTALCVLPIAGERVAGIERDASELPLTAMRDNIDRVLQFMSAKRIKMAHITNKDVLEGNLKSIMRIILALAAHYKPQSVRNPAGAHTVSQKSQNIQVGAGLSPAKKATNDEKSSSNVSVEHSDSEKSVCSESKPRHAMAGSKVPVRRQTTNQGKFR